MGRDWAEQAAEGAARVEARYAGRWTEPPTRHDALTTNAGVMLWQGAPVSLWPAWSAEGPLTVASLYAPLGYERVVASQPLDSAPGRLARALAARPSLIEHVCAPFVMAAVDAEAQTLTLFTDALGVGRLYELRTPHGWVWSNRPEAALAFAGITAAADPVGWAHISVADEMFGDVTPYAGVHAVDAATRIEWDGRAGKLTRSAIDTVASLAAADRSRQAGELIEVAADQLTGMAESVTRLYPDRPVVDLTGGRDSRLVVAAFLAAGADIALHTHDAVPGDLQTARELVALLPDPPEHRIEHVATGGAVTSAPWSATRNAAKWHTFAEALRPYSYLHYHAPGYIDTPGPLTIGGAGGELAHGFYYPARREQLEKSPLGDMLSAFTHTIVQRGAPVAGARAEARAAVRDHVAATLASIAAAGYRDATILDVYYLRERIRRWGSTGERPGVVSPLLGISFVRAALALTPQQRVENMLHRELTRRLAPAWDDVPYFPAERSAPAVRSTRPPRVVRLADATDRDEIHSIITDERAWADHFDTAVVRGLWAASTRGETDTRQERILRAVTWRATFGDHLERLEGAEPSRPHVVWTPPPPVAEPAADAGDAADAIDAVAAQGSAAAKVGMRVTSIEPNGWTRTVARRLAATQAWAELRDTPPGAAVRSVAAQARRRGIRL